MKSERDVGPEGAEVGLLDEERRAFGICVGHLKGGCEWFASIIAACNMLPDNASIISTTLSSYNPKPLAMHVPQERQRSMPHFKSKNRSSSVVSEKVTPSLVASQAV